MLCPLLRHETEEARPDPEPPTISQPSEHAWKNCAARAQMSTARDARPLCPRPYSLQRRFSRAIRQRVCDRISLVRQCVAAPATGILLSVGNREAPADCQCGELIDRVAADALVFPRIPGFHRQRCLHDRRQRNRHGSRIMIRYYTGRKSRVECEQAHTQRRSPGVVGLSAG